MTLANSAYTSRELLFQYQDSGAKLVFVERGLVGTVWEMFREAGVEEGEARRRIVVADLPPPATKTETSGSGGGSGADVNAGKWGAGVQGVNDVLSGSGQAKDGGKENGWGWTLSDFIGKGKLEDEEKFDGEKAHETAYLCYSSGTTGKPKGVEVCPILIYSLSVVSGIPC